MAAATPQLAVLDQLKSDEEIAGFEHVESVELTPHLVLAASLLYMMASDGQIEEEESSQLQATIGGHGALLNFALRYVQQVPVAQFLVQAPEVLSAQDKLCILANVCDSMLSDGRSEPDELALFSQFLEAFGLSESVFGSYFKTITVKNDKTVFGRFEGVSPNTSDITPHLALAASLLYMMSADGAIGTEEIGQLEAVIGEFEGLQQVALTYVRKVKRGEFLRAAGPVLTDSQKLCILTNVCDSMLSDGNVALLEDKLFVSMLEAFGYSENGFQIYYQAIETKNIKPFDTSQFKPHTKHSRLTGGSKEEGEVFDKKLTRNDDKLKVQEANQAVAQKSESTRTSSDEAMGSMIQRTMQDNISSVSQDFGGQDNVVKVSNNATDQLNVQKVNGDGVQGANRQTLEGDASEANVQKINNGDPGAANRQSIGGGVSDANLQKLQTAQDAANRQTIASDAAAPNLQSIATDANAQNRQTIDASQTRTNKQNIDADVYAAYGAPVGIEKLTDNVQEIALDAQLPNVQVVAEAAALEDHVEAEPTDNLADHFEVLTPEVRVKNLFEDIDTLNRKLDDFEQKNKKILEMARQAKLETRRKEEEALAQSMNRQTLAASAQAPNVQTLESEPQYDNVQEVLIETLAVNRQKIPIAFQPAQIVLGASAETTAGMDALNDIATVPAFLGQTQTTGLSQATSVPLAEPTQHSMAQRAPRNGRLKKNRHHAQGVQGRAISYRVYVKATVTFVVLSCWASTIAATDAVRTQRFAGLLERATVVQMVDEMAKKTSD